MGDRQTKIAQRAAETLRDHTRREFEADVLPEKRSRRQSNSDSR